MSDTLPEREDQMDQHQVNRSGVCEIPGCPCRGWSAQETAGVELNNDWQRERFPVGARVEAIIPISRSRLGADIPMGTRGKVTSHCDDGRAWVFFDDYNEGHTFHEIEKFVRVVCTHQNDDERCPANTTSEHQPAARGGGDNGLELPWYWMEGTNRILADTNKQGQKFVICDMFDKGPKGVARARYAVEAVNQHQSLVAELDALKGEALTLVAERDTGLRAIAYLICDGIVNCDKYYPPEMAAWARDLMVGEQRVGIQLIREAIATALNQQRSTSE